MKSTFPLGWLFAIIAALTLGMIQFFSSNFQHLGDNLILSGGWASLLFAVLLVIVLVLSKLKRVSIPLRFKRAATYEALLFIVFLCGLFVTILTNNHFFAVMDKQENIQSEVELQVNQMSEMFNDYQDNVNNRLAAYSAYLTEVNINKNSNRALYEAEGLDSTTIDDLVIMLESDIACDANVYNEINRWTQEMLNKTSSLGLLVLMPRIKDINRKLDNTRDALIEKDKESDKGLNGPHWTYTFTVSEDILRHFKKAEVESISIWSILITILLGLVILLPYFSTERDGRNKGILWELTHQRQNAGSGNIGGI